MRPPNYLSLGFIDKNTALNSYSPFELAGYYVITRRYPYYLFPNIHIKRRKDWH